MYLAQDRFVRYTKVVHGSGAVLLSLLLLTCTFLLFLQNSFPPFVFVVFKVGQFHVSPDTRVTMPCTNPYVRVPFCKTARATPWGPAELRTYNVGNLASFFTFFFAPAVSSHNCLPSANCTCSFFLCLRRCRLQVSSATSSFFM